MIVIVGLLIAGAVLTVAGSLNASAAKDAGDAGAACEQPNWIVLAIVGVLLFMSGIIGLAASEAKRVKQSE
jgi:hypothetical protein